MTIQEKTKLVAKETIQTIADRIVQTFAPERIVLFGSYAYGSPTPDSDLDLLVVMESEGTSAWRSTQVAKAVRPRYISPSVLVYTPDEIKHRLDIGDPYVRTILQKGQVIYERQISRT